MNVMETTVGIQFCVLDNTPGYFSEEPVLQSRRL